MPDTRVLKRRIGSMPMRAEMALANAILARRLRHAIRCNCGTGKQSATCTGKRAAPERLLTPPVEDRMRRTINTLIDLTRQARMNLIEYRENRTWVFGGERARFNHTPTG